MVDADVIVQNEHRSRLSEEEIRDAEAHRGFVREMDHSLGQAYGVGGGVVLGVVVALVVTGWFMGWLSEPLLWVSGITAALGALFIARRRIYARREKLRSRVEKYCEANELPVQTLQQFYSAEDMYPFFAAIFEDQRQRLPDSKQASAEQ